MVSALRADCSAACCASFPEKPSVRPSCSVEPPTKCCRHFLTGAPGVLDRLGIPLEHVGSGPSRLLSGLGRRSADLSRLLSSPLVHVPDVVFVFASAGIVLVALISVVALCHFISSLGLFRVHVLFLSKREHPMSVPGVARFSVVHLLLR